MLISVLLFLMMRSYALVKMSIDPFEISTNEYNTPPDASLALKNCSIVYKNPSTERVEETIAALPR